MTDLKKIIKGKRVLDVGCTGTSYPWKTHEEIGSYGPKYLLGLDRRSGVYPERFKVVKCDVESRDECASAMRRRSKFDTVLMLDVIEHLANCGAALENIKEFFVSSSGMIWIRTPNPLASKWLHQKQTLGYTKTNPDHVHWFDEQTLTSLFTRYGFRVVGLVSESLSPRLEMVFGHEVGLHS